MHSCSRNFNDGVLSQNIGVFEQINVAFLVAADNRARLIQNELLACERAGSDVQPAILKGAFDKPHGNTRRQAEEGESYAAAGGSAFGQKSDGIEEHATEASTNHSAENSIHRLFRRKSNNSVDGAWRYAENHPGNATRNPECGVPCSLRTHACHKRDTNEKHNPSDDADHGSEDRSQQYGKPTAGQRFLGRALNDAFRDAVRDALQSDDKSDQGEGLPCSAGSGSIHEPRLDRSPASGCADESGKTQVEPALQENAAALFLGCFNRFVGGVGHAAIDFGATWARTRDGRRMNRWSGINSR